MKLVIAGTPGAGATLEEGRETPADTYFWSPTSTADTDSVAGLAAALVQFEAEVAEQQVDEIVLADDSDAALAAALIGSKLPVAVHAMPAAREARSANGRLIAQLADAYTPPP
jgi:hypothetical protein